MKLRAKFLTSLSLGLTALAPYLLSQEEPQLNFVRDWVGYRVVPEFAPNANNIEIFNDYCIDFQEDPSDQDACSAFSPYGLEYDAFLDLLSAAYSENRGGVIDFETPILGPTYRSPGRRDYRAFIENYILDNPLESFEAQVRSEQPGLGDADVLALATALQYETAYAAAEVALLDPADIIPVVARIDRARDDTTDLPIIEQTLASDVIGFYGAQKNIPLRIRRGENSYTEGQLATVNFPAPWDLANFINGEMFPNLGISTYSGNGAYRPTSGINTFNSGMHDLIIDPRDNVTAVGFVFLTYGNFQYYQGDSGTPVNPNNMRVFAEFSNGESEELAQTSRQSSGNWDTFFGIQAPEGASITRLWLRVVGRNWRTFVAIDDFAFITEPALPYVAGDTEFTGSAGADFYEILLTGQSPESVTIENLPAGLSFNPVTGLISGTFAEAGSFTSTVIMTNGVGTAEESLVFEVGPAEETVIELDPIGDALVILRRELPTVTILSNLDDILPAGSIDYFALVERIRGDGTRELSSLDFLGLTLRDNTIFGTPGEAQQIGEYEVRVFARTETSADSAVFRISVLAPTLGPNFDSNKTSDFAVFSGDAIWIAYNDADGESPGKIGLTKAIIGLPSGAEIYTGDFNGDNRTDFLGWDPASGRLNQYLSTGVNAGFNRSTLLSGIKGESIVAVNDYNGDGNTDIAWFNGTTGRKSFWLLQNGLISWAGIMDFEDAAGETVLSGDFAGNGSVMHLNRKAEGQYCLQQFNSFTSLGAVQTSSIEFTMDTRWEPVVAADFSNDGSEDILWVDSATGEATLWVMSGLSTSTRYLLENDDGSLTGTAGTALLPYAFDWGVVSAVDLNNDQYADLILRNRRTQELGVLFLQINRSIGEILVVGDFQRDLLSVGDYDGDSRNDMLLLDKRTNRLEIITTAESGDYLVTDYVENPASGKWLSDVEARNSAPAIEASYSWMGPYTFIDNGWMRIRLWGYAYPVGYNREDHSVWIYDPKLGYLWTSREVFPDFIFQPRNFFYLQWVQGSNNPREFWNYLFGFYMPEDAL